MNKLRRYAMNTIEINGISYECETEENKYDEKIMDGIAQDSIIVDDNHYWAGFRYIWQPEGNEPDGYDYPL